VVSTGGSMLLALVGLPIAFLFNSASYLIAAASLWRLPGLSLRSAAQWERLSALRLSLDLRDGIIYLARQPTLLYPLLLTFVTVVITTPSFGLLAAVVHKRGGSIISLGLLGASVSLGAFIGAVYAGSRGEGDHPIRRYALYGTGAAAALVAFAITPMSFVTPLPLAVIGFILFSEAVWNTSRVRLLAAAPFQARLQSITTMAFTLGSAVGQLWGGIALDRFGVMSLVGGAIVLVVLAVTVWSLAHRLARQKAEG